MNNKNSVSIIIPVIRPQNIKNLVKLIKENAGVSKDSYEILIEEDKDKIGAPKMVKKLVDKSKNDLIMFLGDDCEPLPNFLLHALETMKSFQGEWGLVGLYDVERPGDHSPAHWLAHKKLLKFSGDFFYTGYIHQYCDNELCLWANSLNRYKLNKLAKVNHKHPGFKNKDKTFMENIEATDDENVKRVYSDQVYEHDKALFKKRQKIIIRKTHKYIPLSIQPGPSMLAGSLAIMGKDIDYQENSKMGRINIEILNMFNCSFKHPDLPEGFEDDPRLDSLYNKAYNIKEFIIEHPITMVTLPFWRKAFTILPIFMNRDIDTIVLSLLGRQHITITEGRQIQTEYISKIREEVTKGMRLVEFNYKDYILNPIPYIKRTYLSFGISWMYDKSKKDELKEFVNLKLKH